ncbi:hypothetical protein BC629DRAFT_1586420 [Irpex lacteus]|nr:hypothetical protein BC629DRAFT_1586420 [Irpex lacteus]
MSSQYTRAKNAANTTYDLEDHGSLAYYGQLSLMSVGDELKSVTPTSCLGDVLWLDTSCTGAYHILRLDSVIIDDDTLRIARYYSYHISFGAQPHDNSQRVASLIQLSSHADYFEAFTGSTLELTSKTSTPIERHSRELSCGEPRTIFARASF